jgi:PKD repeat protein
VPNGGGRDHSLLTSFDTNSACAFGGIKFKSLAQPADQWTWDFGDGNTNTLFEDSVFHSYTDTGTFNVQLTVLNNGCPNSISKPQLIKINPPVANFIDTILNCGQQVTVNFLNTSKTDPSFGPITYLWSFGDPANTTSAAASPVFTYPALGSYVVTLTVTNGSCSNTITREITLVSEVADFTASKLNPCRNEVFVISALGNSNNIVQYEWVLELILP